MIGYASSKQQLRDFVVKLLKDEFWVDVESSPDSPDEPSADNNDTDQILSIFGGSKKNQECGWIYTTEKGIRIQDGLCNEDLLKVAEKVRIHYSFTVDWFLAPQCLWLDIRAEEVGHE